MIPLVLISVFKVCVFIMCLSYSDITSKHQKIIFSGIIFIFNKFKYCNMFKSLPGIPHGYKYGFNAVCVLDMVYLNLELSNLYHQL